MKIQDIPHYFGHSQKLLAEIVGKSPQALSNYIAGGKGTESKFKRDLADACELNLEEVFFADAFDHPAGCDSDSPFYYLNLALEGLRIANEKGLDTTEISKSILLFEKQLPELPQPTFEAWENLDKQ